MNANERTVRRPNDRDADAADDSNDMPAVAMDERRNCRRGGGGTIDGADDDDDDAWATIIVSADDQ